MTTSGAKQAVREPIEAAVPSEVEQLLADTQGEERRVVYEVAAVLRQNSEKAVSLAFLGKELIFSSKQWLRKEKKKLVEVLRGHDALFQVDKAAHPMVVYIGPDSIPNQERTNWLLLF